MKIFISTHVKDAHAVAVQTALESRGHEVVRWIGSDCPERESQSYRIGASGQYTKFSSELAEFDPAEFDAVWWRRQSTARIPDWVHHSDRQFAELEWKAMYAHLPHLFAEKCFWVNPPKGRALADMKLHQLRVAKAVGLKIPETLISNKPVEIREFERDFGPLIHKMLEPALWRNETHLARSRTRKISAEMLGNGRMLSLCPGVYQQYIPKLFEIRATFFGKRCEAARIEPVELDTGVSDWRSSPSGHWTLEVIQLPDSVYQASLRLMSRLNINFGCFDFVVDEAGNHYFLEVNENGNFLWVERENQQFRLLEAFCDHLTINCGSEAGQFSGLTFEDVRQLPRFKELYGADEENHSSELQQPVAVF